MLRILMHRIANTLNAMVKLGLSVEGLEAQLRSAVSRNVKILMHRELQILCNGKARVISKRP